MPKWLRCIIGGEPVPARTHVNVKGQAFTVAACEKHGFWRSVKSEELPAIADQGEGGEMSEVAAAAASSAFWTANG
jgi:hypothetical protein